MSPDVNDPGKRLVTFDDLVGAYEEQALALIEEGCQRAQGYLYSPPAPRDEVPELLAALGEGCAPLVEPLP